MKSLITIITAGIIFLSGCSENSNVLTPEVNSSTGPNWITLPQRNGSHVEAEYSVTELIDGAAGGKLEINEVYFGGPQNVVKLNIKLKFPQNCFPGTETITMVVDNVNGTVTYSPHMNFDIPATLDLEFQGIDLTGVNPDSIDFVYQDPDGSFDSMVYDRITVNMVNGSITLKDGKIPHFSRYGFSR